MSGPQKQREEPDARPWRPRFGLATMLLVMLVFCVVGAAGSYLVPAVRQGTPPKAVFIIFTLAVPMLLVVALSLGQKFIQLLSRRGRR